MIGLGGLGGIGIGVGMEGGLVYFSFFSSFKVSFRYDIFRGCRVELSGIVYFFYVGCNKWGLRLY